VRDHAFPLLLHKNAGEFPIVYASRIGQSHKGIAVNSKQILSRFMLICLHSVPVIDRHRNLIVRGVLKVMTDSAEIDSGDAELGVIL
jgi:hypothetical protein